MKLNTLPAVARPDDLYEDLIEMHRGLDDRQSAVANAKLVLLLCNHVGDGGVIREAIGLTRASMLSAEPPQT